MELTETAVTKFIQKCKFQGIFWSRRNSGEYNSSVLKEEKGPTRNCRNFKETNRIKEKFRVVEDWKRYHDGYSL